MTKRATIFLLSAFFTAGTALAQTAPPPAADEAQVPDLEAPTRAEPDATAPETGEEGEAATPDFTPVAIDDPHVPDPIASRAVPPDYTQPDAETVAGANTGAETAHRSPDEPQPTPEVGGVPTEPEQSVMSPAAAEALDAPSDSASAGDRDGAQNDDDGVASAETPPDQAEADGTSPGSAGSSGWTGGLGGSMIGTNPAGAVPESTTWQPPTARGLDLRG